MKLQNALLFIFVCIWLVSCGGGGGGGSNSGSGSGSDTTPPSGYAVSFVQSSIDESNENSVSFSVSGAEVGASYSYTINLGSSEISGGGAVSQLNFDITGLDLGSFPAGEISLVFSLTDSAGNSGVDSVDSISKTSVPDEVAPSGYAATFGPTQIDETNERIVSFSVVDAEIGASYSYLITAGSSQLSGTGTVLAANFDVLGLDLSNFPAGQVSLSFSLTDPAGNTGADSIDSVTKISVPDTSAPVGYSVSFLTDPIDLTNQEAVGFAVTGAEIDADYEYALIGSESDLTGSGQVTQADFDITGLDLSDFQNGDVTLEFRLIDESGNIGTVVTDTTTKSTSVVLSGSVTYDFVPHQADQFGLDYDGIEQRAVRGATVQILDSENDVIASTKTSQDGEYSLDLDPNQNIRVRVLAEILEEGTASWDFSVTDNTSGNAVYALDGDLEELGGNDQTRDLEARSGWGGSSYTTTRAAAPFAILDTVYTTVMMFVEVDPSIQFPSAEVRWSINNVDIDGDISLGEIGSSSYVSFRTSNSDSGNIYLVGDEDVNTDEYDAHVIVHEWGHYFQDRLSRSDSIGGGHGAGDILDMRVSFSEGWGNALSAIALDDPIYKNSVLAGQQRGFTLNIDSNAPTEVNGSVINTDAGWYNEFSVHSLLYDLYDADTGEAEKIELGLAPLYQAFIDESFVNQNSLVTIFSFLTQLSEEEPAQSNAISDLAVSQDINGEGFYGVSETNDAGVSQTLPVYKPVTLDTAALEVCTDNLFGEYNHLNNRAFAQFNILNSGNYTLSASRSSGLVTADPELIGWGFVFDGGSRFGGFISCGDSEPGSGTSETLTCFLPEGDYVLEVFDAANVDDDDNTGGAVCFDLSVTSG